MNDIPQILLAAGASKRMGKPKALLEWKEKTLIEHQIKTLSKTGQSTIVILGAYSEQIRPVIKDFPVLIFTFKDWAVGMGGTIAFGLKILTKNFPSAKGVLISLLDQPCLTENHYEKMIKTFEPNKQQIIVSQDFSGWKGAPAIFDKYYFEELKKLSSDKGAKEIIAQNKSIAIPTKKKALRDIDTFEEYLTLKKTK